MLQSLVRKDLLDGGSFNWIAFQTVENELLHGFRDGAFDAGLFSLHFGNQLELLRAFPRRLLMDHLKQHHSKGKDIRSKTVLTTLQSLGTHVQRRTQIELVLTQPAFLDGEPVVP